MNSETDDRPVARTDTTVGTHQRQIFARANRALIVRNALLTEELKRCAADFEEVARIVETSVGVRSAAQVREFAARVRDAIMSPPEPIAELKDVV